MKRSQKRGGKVLSAMSASREEKAREIESYQRIIAEIWRRIASVLGPLCLKAIAERAVALTSAEFGFITMISIKG